MLLDAPKFTLQHSEGLCAQMLQEQEVSNAVRCTTNTLSRFKHIFLPLVFHLSNAHCINTMALLGSSTERMWQGLRFLITL